MKILLVEWRDSITGRSWAPKQSTISEAVVERCISVGILAKETDKEIVLIPNMSITAANVLHDLAIPKGAVVRVRQLKICWKLKRFVYQVDTGEQTTPSSFTERR